MKRVKRVIKKETKELLVAALQEACPYGDRDFYKIVVDLCELHSDKNADYASREDPLSNFRRVGDRLSEYQLITPKRTSAKIAFVYMWKQIDAAYKLLGRSETGGIQGVTDRLDDIAVYAILARILYQRGI